MVTPSSGVHPAFEWRRREIRTRTLRLREEFFMLDYVWLIPLFPAIGFLINGFFGRTFGEDKWSVGWACSALGLSFLTSILIFFELIGKTSCGTPL